MTVAGLERRWSRAIGAKRLASGRFRPSTGTLICPLCAGPKTLQAEICQPCWIDKVRAEHGARHVHGLVQNYRRTCRCDACLEGYRRFHRERRRVRSEVTGGLTGRPQPQGHPWRKTLTRVA